MPLEKLKNEDIRAYYSTYIDGDNYYLGGSRSFQEVTDNMLHNLLQKTTSEEQVTGIKKYRCLYIFNENDKIYFKNPAAYVTADTSSPNDSVKVGWGTAKIGSGLDGGPFDEIEQIISNQHVKPEGVEFFGGNTRTTGAILGEDIPFKKGKALWVEYDSQFDAQDYPYNTFKIRIEGDNLIPVVLERDTSKMIPQIMFTVMGNCSSDADFASIVRWVKLSSPNFLLTTGNNNMDSIPTTFFNYLGPAYMARMLPALGLLDVVSVPVYNAYVNEIAKHRFIKNFRSGYYSKTYGNVHILVMNTSGSVSYQKGSAQYEFILKDLKAANADPAIEWIFVVSNRPVYGTPVLNTTRHYYTDIGKIYHQMFADLGVLIVFQGQVQAFERTYVLKYNPEEPESPQPMAFDGPSNYTISDRKNFVDGVIFMTIGNAGEGHDIMDAAVGGITASFNTIDFGYVRVMIDNRLEEPLVIIRHYITSRNTQYFGSQFSVTRKF